MSDDTQATLRGMAEDLGYIRGKVEAIEEQTKKTNGRVTKAEGDIEKGNRKTTYIVIVGVAVLTALFILNPQLQEVIKALIKP